ncbi:Putative quercetin 2,3-dioxygenase [Zhongshania aliphaticivorans]|uniref:Quercetin 2,3-dioxygenase n=1 Tax=Zhongshania aliphaticivorans TaxID=1470434 RepID=A0A5S9PLB6_9GAMM|nr:pirin family protein [Zhongshania aliphaticivorans]CAA0104707.1 Putative quercetin 2,3-dioxygenase [Zhongshania aliphaticivorans]CAA0104967.1 Putative quercetin 2,3-dioxygenase [Zhongshania aliphaticivorans]
MKTRTVTRIISAQPTSDGAGVKLKRSLGQSNAARHDPFLMLDEFFSDEPADYLAGFPSHPHRGFETVTYMLEGHMLHQDHLGNQGHLKDGGVQWMTAGRGIIHSEMPQQNHGRMRGFQLWINLPSAEKMQAASYQDITADKIPRLSLDSSSEAILIAGHTVINHLSATGFINGIDGKALSTDPIYIDLRLAPEKNAEVSLPPDHHAVIYVYEGEVTIEGTSITKSCSAILDGGDTLNINTHSGAGILILAGRPIGEPIVQYGPFVMTTNDEIEQALRDYRDGVLVSAK